MKLEKNAAELIRSISGAEDRLIECNSFLKRISSLRGSSKWKNEASKAECAKIILSNLKELQKLEDGPIEYVRKSTIGQYGMYRIEEIVSLYYKGMLDQLNSLEKNITLMPFQYLQNDNYSQHEQSICAYIWTGIPATEYNKTKCGEIVGRIINHLESKCQR